MNAGGALESRRGAWIQERCLDLHRTGAWIQERCVPVLGREGMQIVATVSVVCLFVVVLL